MAFVGFTPAFMQSFEQGQKLAQAKMLQRQEAEQRLAELQKRFELEASLPTAQQRQAQAFATDPNVRKLMEFQADPLGLKARGLDIEEQGLEAKLAALSPESRRTGQIQNFNFLLQMGVENFRRTKGKDPNPEELEALTNKARDIAFREDPFTSLQRTILNQDKPSPIQQ